MAMPNPAPQAESQTSVTSPPQPEKGPAENALLAFKSETRLEASVERPRAPRVRRPAPSWMRTALLIAGAIVVAVAGTTVALSSQLGQAARIPAPVAAPRAALPAEGLLTVDSRPQGAQVNVDSILRGVTPLKISLPIGDHTLELQSGGATRSLPVTIQSNVVVSQYVELSAAAGALLVGRLDVSSDPPGARIAVDGVARGTTPASLANVSPGPHTVTISGAASSVTRNVIVSAGATASVLASLLRAGSAAGWLRFDTPVEFQVFEDGKLVGTTRTDRLMLPAGEHDLVLANTSLEAQVPISIQVQAGGVTTPAIALPTGSLSINATPWAEVLLDGQAVGTTPLANLKVPVGSHEIVWRHPQFGERRQTVVVKANTPARVGIVLNK